MGMNLTSGGGQSFKLSDKTRKQMKERKRQPHTDATKLKMSLRSKGKKKNYSSRKGVKLSEETKRKISQNHSHSTPMLGKRHSESTKNKIRLSRIGKPAHNKKPIKNILTGIIYPSKIEAAESIGMKVRTLKAKLEGKLKNNTHFRYA